MRQMDVTYRMKSNSVENARAQIMRLVAAVRARRSLVLILRGWSLVYRKRKSAKRQQYTLSTAALQIFSESLGRIREKFGGVERGVTYQTGRRFPQA
jgi:hypothetical protein